MSSAPPLLASVRALVKRYGAAPAVDGVDLDVAPGEIVGLLGPNGAGKTTTLECLLGLRTPDSGEILLDGVDVRTRPAEARRRVGAQIQPAAFQDKITPREALAFFASFHATPADVGELLARFALEEKADAPFDSLSTGQRQRLCVALAFVNRAALLVLDEPTTGLDPHARRALHRVLEDYRAGGGAVLLSTHDLDEAQRLCDRVAILHRGRIVAAAPPAELVTRTGAATRIVFRTARQLGEDVLASLPSALPRSEVRNSFVPQEPRSSRSETRQEFRSDFASANSSRSEARQELRPGSAAPHQLRTTAPARTIAALTALLQAEHNELLALELLPPTLEDAFVALTGEGWDGTPETGA